jgi:hypothetical protein
MKTAYKNLEYIEGLSFKKEKPSILKNVFELFLNLGIFYIASKLYVDLWRSMTGH